MVMHKLPMTKIHTKSCEILHILFLVMTFKVISAIKGNSGTGADGHLCSERQEVRFGS